MIETIEIEPGVCPEHPRKLKNFYHVIKVNGEEAGHSGAVQSVTHPELGVYGPLGLDPRFRGKGCGQRVLGATLTALREAGVRALYMGSGNLPAYFTYLKAGFIPIFPTARQCSNRTLKADQYRSFGLSKDYPCFISLMENIPDLAPLLFFRNMMRGESGEEFERKYYAVDGPLKIRPMEEDDYVELPVLLNQPYRLVVRNFSLNLFDLEPLIDIQMSALRGILDRTAISHCSYFNINGALACRMATKAGVLVGFGTLAGTLSYERVLTKTGAGTLDMVFHPRHGDFDNYKRLFMELLAIGQDLDFPKKLNKLRVFLTEGDPRIEFYTQLGFKHEACLKKEVREHDLHVYRRSV